MTRIRQLTRKDVDFTVTFEPDFDPPSDSFATGDPQQDLAICQEINEDMEYNELAWCVATVTAHCDGFTAQDTLGGLSMLRKHGDPYKQFDAHYRDQMEEEALAQLQKQMQESLDKLLKLTV